MTGARFSDKVVLITGAGSGIGSQMAARFAAEGARVAVVDKDAAAAQHVADTLPDAAAIVADLQDRDGCHTAASAVHDRLGPVDVLVNNALSFTETPFASLTDDEWNLDIAVNLAAPFRMIQEVLPDLTAARGVVMNISSVNALAYFGNESYSAAKAGMLSLTRSLAVRYGPQGIRVVAVVPGTIVTQAWDERIARDPDVLAKVAVWYPLGRLGTTDDVASAVLFLCSDEASWITGTSLVVDGGLMAGNPIMTTDILGNE